MTSSPTVADVAAEAEFQLMVAKDYQVWLCALARAIHVSYAHDGGRHADDLVGLVQFLDETNCGDIQTQIDQFQQVYKDHSAPQKQISPERGAGNPDRLSLATFAKGRQHDAAKDLGVQQAAISKAIRVGRAIYVTRQADGSCSAVEERPFPCSRFGGAA